MEKLDAITFDQMLQEQDPFAKENPVINLGDIQLITSTALVQLAALCFALSESGQRPSILVNDAAVRSYLDRARFLSAVEAVANIEPPLYHYVPGSYASQRGANPTLIEVTRIATRAELPKLLDSMILVLTDRLKYRNQDAFDIATVASEILQNTLDHNNAACGFAALQVYGQGTHRFLELGVADYGNGLTVTLARNPENMPIASDLDAIMKAI